MQLFPWTEYSKKMSNKILDAKNSGYFSDEEARLRNCFVAKGKSGSVDDGNVLELYLLVDKEDGMILDAKYFVYGETPLIAALEGLSELVIHKYYDQAKRMGADLIDKHLRDKHDKEAFPASVSSHLNLAIDALDEAISTCFDIPLPASYVSPLPREIEGIEGGYPNFEQLTLVQKLAVIEEVIKEEIRPYIELDGGGIEVLNLLNDNEVIIAYQGSCTTCFSSTGATLSYIQQTLKAKVHPDLIVIPNL